MLGPMFRYALGRHRTNISAHNPAFPEFCDSFVLPGTFVLTNYGNRLAETESK